MNVQIDKATLSNVRFVLRGIQDEAPPKILSRALNATAKKARTEGSKAIRKEVNLKASYVNSRLTIRKATFRNLQSKVITPNRGLLLSRFSTNAQVRNENISWIKPPPQVPKRGIKVKVSPPGGGSKTITGDPPDTKGQPFYIALSNGRAAIAARRKQLGPPRGGGKLKVFYGPSLSQVFNNVVDDLRGPLAEYQEEQVSKQIDSVLRGY